MGNRFEDVIPPSRLQEYFNREAFNRTLRMLQENGGPLLDNTPKPKQPEPKPEKKMRVYTVKDLYRMPIGHSGDIPRRCQTCENPPTQFATVYSAKLTLTYHFCNPCFIEYINKEVPKDHDGPTRRHLTGDRNDSKSVDGRNTLTIADNRPDPNIHRTERRESVSVGTKETSRSNSDSQQEDDGVEAAGILALGEAVSAVTELLCTVVSQD